MKPFCIRMGLDDVVVTYNDGRTRFIQVKHTRADDTITFGDLVTKDQSTEGTRSQKKSVLAELAESWEKSKEKFPDSEVYVFTNRTIGKRSSTAGPGRSIKRPALAIFWKELQEKVSTAKTFSDIKFYCIIWKVKDSLNVNSYYDVIIDVRNSLRIN